MQGPFASKHTHHLLLFTKYPAPGFAKTRLIPVKGPDGAALISNQLTQKTLQTVARFQQHDPNAQTIIHYATHEVLPISKIEEWIQPRERQSLCLQRNGDLGARLIAAFENSFKRGAMKVVVIGSDAPDLTESILLNSFALLDEADVVVGPAVDGGYYLLGLRQMNRKLFTSIPWSTSTVFRDTMAAAESSDLSTKMLPKLRDIDTPEDLQYLTA
ncbi:hypothetical protein BWQ96_08683 [Gracilariopsis chorda]|uniref:Glycosyltransferase n=1 Tax=Gracilariopsis chorda TaxID=448386 RepID=A0A2V3IHM8_9FLOR|nr:hypothetical protein BWQ96_08683 [Gracilariopsis chorda]|eukprot:PXF41596.1 hypothetical protein BWQ96_08683 [Gracilariopsis chorda]